MTKFLVRPLDPAGLAPRPISHRLRSQLPYFTNPGSFLPLDLRPHSMRAFSSVAQSTARKGILFALRMVSNLDVAVMMCEDPAVSEV